MYSVSFDVFSFESKKESIKFQEKVTNFIMDLIQNTDLVCLSDIEDIEK